MARHWPGFGPALGEAKRKNIRNLAFAVWAGGPTVGRSLNLGPAAGRSLKEKSIRKLDFAFWASDAAAGRSLSLGPPVGRRIFYSAFVSKGFWPWLHRWPKKQLAIRFIMLDVIIESCAMCNKKNEEKNGDEPQTELNLTLGLSTCHRKAKKVRMSFVGPSNAFACDCTPSKLTTTIHSTFGVPPPPNQRICYVPASSQQFCIKPWNRLEVLLMPLKTSALISHACGTVIHVFVWCPAWTSPKLAAWTVCGFMQNSKMDAPTLTQMGKGETGILKLNIF